MLIIIVVILVVSCCLVFGLCFHGNVPSLTKVPGRGGFMAQPQWLDERLQILVGEQFQSVARGSRAVIRNTAGYSVILLVCSPVFFGPSKCGWCGAWLGKERSVYMAGMGCLDRWSGLLCVAHGIHYLCNYNMCSI